ncbi:MAG: carboxypeptidase-like regulatory domain-containing protein [Nitrospirota bacterium]
MKEFRVSSFGFRGRNIFIGILLLFTFHFSLFTPLVLATHEVNHRFKVHGYVRDENGSPVKDARVMVVVSRLDEGTTTFSDKNGYYEVTLHIHDTGLGEEIIVTAQGERKKIAAEFDPNNKTDERGKEVNFGGGAAGRSDKKGGNFWIYGVGAVIAGGIILYIGFHNKKKAGKKNGKNLKKRKKG